MLKSNLRQNNDKEVKRRVRGIVDEKRINLKYNCDVNAT